VILAGLVATGVGLAWTPTVAARLQLGAEPSTANLPVAGAQFIEQHHLPGPIFNFQPWGGYLIYRWYPNPDRRVFIDGRIDMYGSAIGAEYDAVTSVQPDWKAVLDKHGIQTILIDRGDPLSTLLVADGGWERVFQGSVEEVFVRNPSISPRSRARWSPTAFSAARSPSTRATSART
jgi:hypothetical protein